MNTITAALGAAAIAMLGAWQIQAQDAEAPDAACLSRLLQSSRALAMYTRDNDSRFPPANEWNDALAPFLPKPAAREANAKNTPPLPSPFDCPLLGAGGWGYSMNWKLSKRQASELDDLPGTVALYETNVPRPDAAYDGRDLMPRHSRQLGGTDGAPIRNEAGGNFAFADGSVSWLPATTTPNFRIFRDNKPRPPK